MSLSKRPCRLWAKAKLNPQMKVSGGHPTAQAFGRASLVTRNYFRVSGTQDGERPWGFRTQTAFWLSNSLYLLSLLRLTCPFSTHAQRWFSLLKKSGRIWYGGTHLSPQHLGGKGRRLRSSCPPSAIEWIQGQSGLQESLSWKGKKKDEEKMEAEMKWGGYLVWW